MRLVIDLQGAQSSGSRNRGIGRYSTALTKAMLAMCGEHEVHLLLNGAFAGTVEPIRAEFDGLLPAQRVHVWMPPTPCHAADAANATRRLAAEHIREAVLAGLQPDALLITSLFEGLGDDAVITVAASGSSIPTAVVLYDLIPLIHAKVYLPNPVVSQWYLNKIDQLRRADLLLSISASSGREGVQYLGFPEERVTNISTACDEQFKPVVVGPVRREALAQRYGLTRPFVMYTGGIDYRKNIEGLIRAYAALPRALRVAHQLAVVCSVQAPDRERLEALATQHGLATGEFIMTGFVPDADLVDLYNLCQVFVFPSWHEGFGLPALEAMACGRAVIGANTSSVPEVIGRDDALFDPFKDEAITAKLRQVLEDPVFRAELEAHGLAQAQRFSWQEGARAAWRALEALPLRPSAALATLQTRPRLAFVSPLPLARSGIADYSAELLPELSRHYQIDVVVCQDEPLEDPWVLANCRQLSVSDFRQQAQRYQRVLYHFGNSHFHAHMFGLLEEHPGVVVLHDFFLSSISAHMDYTGKTTGGWARELLASHGWPAMHSRFNAVDTSDAIWAYPCNLSVLQNALGVVVHSENSRRLAQAWYGEDSARNWPVIPHMRVPVHELDRTGTRRQLGIAQDEFVVCSFGLLGRTKLNHRLLQAWLASPLATSLRCRLVFVGQNDGGDYGHELVKTIRSAGRAIEITGWADASTYKDWLAIADVAVQLRTHSRGETSGTVLDCMNYGVPTVVNAHGAMQDLPGNAVHMLPDTFSDAELTQALTELWQQPAQRLRLSAAGRSLILREHQPRACADLYAQAIEGFYTSADMGAAGVVKRLGQRMAGAPEGDVRQVAQSLSINFPPKPRRRQLLVDVSELVQRDSRSGIQRVVRSLILELLTKQSFGWQVEPVYATADVQGYRYARRFACRLLNVSDSWAQDSVVEAWAGDRFLALDLQPHILTSQAQTLRTWQTRGVETCAVLYDLLPLTLPTTFREGEAHYFSPWLDFLAKLNSVVAISLTVSNEYLDWLDCCGPSQRMLPLKVSHFHLGADIENSVPTKGFPPDAQSVLEPMKTHPTFLMVGTVEARKGHTSVLNAVERLWDQGVIVHLVIVGKQGWKVESLVERLNSHPKAGTFLHWAKDASDEYLEAIYARSSCLVAASEGEGFGLPLIEAARHKLPIIVRDIPVFREVAGVHAFYFQEDATSEELAEKLSEWLKLFKSDQHPRSQGMAWLTWRESAAQLIDALDGKAPYKTWLPKPGCRFWGNDLRFHTQIGRRQGKSMHTTGCAGFLVYGPYQALEAGRYRLSMNGWARTWSGDEYFDVSCAGGTRHLLHVQFVPTAAGAWTHLAFIELESPVADFEFRLWVSDGSDLSLAQMEIVPDTASLSKTIDTLDVVDILDLAETVDPKNTGGSKREEVRVVDLDIATEPQVSSHSDASNKRVPSPVHVAAPAKRASKNRKNRK